MSVNSVIAEGLTILGKYGGDVQIEYGALYAGPKNLKRISKKDAARLEELGWSIDEEWEERWAFFN